MRELTKSALASSLKKMLSSKTLDNITVTDIAEDCGVNRQTFYYHFQDIYALLDWIFVSETKNAIQAEVSYANWAICLENVFAYMLENKNFFINVYHSVSREVIERYLYDIQNHYLDIVISELDQDKILSLEDKRFMERFIAYAIVGTILEWIKNGMHTDYHLITKRIKRIMSGDILKYMI